MRRIVLIALVLAVAVVAAWPAAAETPSPTPIGTPAATLTAAHTPTPTGTPTPTPAATAVVQVATANIRSGPGTAYAVIGQARKGQKLAVTGRDSAGKWWQVDLNGRPGWISAGLVQTDAALVAVKSVTDATAPATLAPAAGPSLPAYQASVVLRSDTTYPVRAGSVKGWGYELVDRSEQYDLLVNRDVFGAVANQLWPDLLKQHPKGLRITFKDADPSAKYSGGFGDGQGAYVVPGGCQATHQDDNGTIWQNQVVDCSITLVSPGPGLSDIALAATVLGYGEEVSAGFSPIFSQAPYTQLGKAARDVDTGQWHWKDPFLQVVSLTAPPAATPAPEVTSGPRTPPPPATGHIAFTQGRGNATDIAVVDLASKAIAVAAGNGRQPDTRSDGRIVFNGTGGGRNDLQAVDPDGRNLRAVSVHPEDSAPRWSDDGQSVAFHSTLAGGSDERLYLQLDASNRAEPLHLQVDGQGGAHALWGAYPFWVGRNLGFQGCDYWEGGSACGIWVSPLNWAPIISQVSIRQLTGNPQDRPNDVYGGTLLYSAPADGNWDVYAMPLAGGKGRNLTNSPSQDLGASFSPDGNYIAFMSDRGGGWGIWIMEADGSNPRLLVNVPQGFGKDWSEERLSWGP
jgi:uncharacterized protein YraI